jgi:phage baseplate assembly protein W
VGNNGTWAFTLTVVGIPSPQVSLTPQVPLLPTGVEIAVPFQIDSATGGIAYLTDFSQIIAQHVETIVMTGLTERVMEPKYGSKLPHAVFQPITAGRDAILGKDIQEAINKWEPAVHVQRVSVEPQGAGSSQLNVLVSYSIIPFADVNTVTVTTGGTISQVRAP